MSAKPGPDRFGGGPLMTTTPPALPAPYLRYLPPAAPPASSRFLRLQQRARAVLVAGSPAPLPRHVLELQKRIRDRIRIEAFDTSAGRHRLYVLDIAGPNPRIKIGCTENAWNRLDDHLREMNRYQYALVGAHLTACLPDLRTLKRAESRAHGWMASHYQAVTREEYANADYGFGVNCADAAAGLHIDWST